MTTAILSTTYFGPIQWYQKLHRYNLCIVEQYDHFQKQTFRNRCVIATTAGTQALTVPVERPADSRLDKTLVRDIRISDHGSWRHLHWNALCSAYGESPFFEFYEDDLRPFFDKKWEFLIDFNMAITSKMCELLQIEPNIRLSEEYIEASSCGDADDYRDVIRPKHPLPDESFSPQPYYQVYSLKHGFMPNMSILDLLFNEGNESIYYM